MRFGIVLLTTAFVLVSTPVAFADETAPDCESTQPWIGYTSTTAVRDTYNQDLGHPGDLNVCEGEHWDGQDTVRSDQAEASCTGTVNADPNALFAGICSDNGAADGWSESNPLTPLGLRVSSDGTNAVYVGTNIVLVGKAVLYVDHSAVAVYVEDNTPTNALATVVSAPRVTQGHVDETDCDQATYQDGAINHTAACGRDNTAITVEHAVLA
ncbi:MAG TPA: hypothetical protein VM370_07340 [Candidatus Thermoplasmatota archaeon]|nr:hypothetical protein [Candidatus Thermoplasmatota archaeon]